MGKIKFPRKKEIINYDEEESSCEDLFKDEDHYKRATILFDDNDTDVML